jgi:intracellular sulfur oxidation DsrE/DsrF family protein
MAEQTSSRRDVITRLGTIAAVVGAFATRGVRAQEAPAAASFSPQLHDEDAWMSAMPGVHRVVLDITSPGGVPEGLRFANNVLAGHRSGYGLTDADTALIVCLRHGATAYGYSNTIWSKYGGTLDSDAATAPTANPYNSGNRTALSNLAGRGVEFMVCGVATRGLASRIAGPGGDSAAVFEEMTANLNPSARIVTAGVVGVTHAQERGFSLLYVG